TAFPDIDLRLQHSPLPVYRQLTDVDLAIAWGDGDWTGMQADLLLRVEVSPVLAPDLAPEGFSLWNPADVLQLPLLHQRSTAPWREWLGAAGVEAAGADLEGQIFEDANILMQAVLARKGAGLGVVPFVAGDLDAGRLIQPWPLAVDPGDAYYLVSPRRARLPAAVSAVRDWLRSQAQG
ncbi:MAG: LysR substrate-binding domain-containing protein, partial [Pseudomonadota bacterium]